MLLTHNNEHTPHLRQELGNYLGHEHLIWTSGSIPSCCTNRSMRGLWRRYEFWFGSSPFKGTTSLETINNGTSEVIHQTALSSSQELLSASELTNCAKKQDWASVSWQIRKSNRLLTKERKADRRQNKVELTRKRESRGQTKLNLTFS